MRTVRKHRRGYRNLYLIVFAILIILGVSPASAIHAATASGNVDLSATVPGPPPTTAPTIDQPSQGQTFDQKNISIKGTCTPQLIVKIFRNDLFAGSTICSASGTYELRIDLFENRNDLVARQYDSLSQPSPPSDTVTVYYIPTTQQPTLPGTTVITAPTVGNSTSTTGNDKQVAMFQFSIQYDYTQQGMVINRPFYLPIHFSGGVGPYAISIDWGDGVQEVHSRDDTSVFTVNHTYKKNGNYVVKIRATDHDGQKAYLQFAVMTSGNSGHVGTGVTLHNPFWRTLLMCVIAGIIIFSVGIAVGFKLAKRQPQNDAGTKK